MWQLGGQLSAVAAVVAVGVAVHTGLRATHHSLEQARAREVASQRLADLSARFVRAPLWIADELRRLPGVRDVEPRVSVRGRATTPGDGAPVTLSIVSLAPDPERSLNAVLLRDGRLPRFRDEVLLHEPFAEAHGLEPGASLAVTIEGRRTEWTVAGTALSPEFTFVAPPGSVLPDDARYGVIFAGLEPLQHAAGLRGACNEVILSCDPRGPPPGLAAAVEDALARYGCVAAVAREDQPSEAFVQSELDQLRVFGTVIPLGFLTVAAFLLHIVIGRAITSQRTQAAALLALGYRVRDLAIQFAAMGLVASFAGFAVGLPLAAWIGRALCTLYLDYFRLPSLEFGLPLREVLTALGVTLAAASSGTFLAVRRIAALSPAEGMRPPAPPRFRATLPERLGLLRHLSPQLRSVGRSLLRRPGRAIAATLGASAATALVILGSFAYGAIREALELQFGFVSRADVAITLIAPRSLSALHSIEGMPGVVAAEPRRTVPARIRARGALIDTAITGVPTNAALSIPIGSDSGLAPCPPTGLGLEASLAAELGVDAGDRVDVEVRAGRRPRFTATVTRVSRTFLGREARMDLEELCRSLGEGPGFDTALLHVPDRRQLPALRRAVRDAPVCAGSWEREHGIRSFVDVLDQHVGTSLAIQVGASLVMAFGVLHSFARVQFGERARELATLRFLGFRDGEILTLLLGEQGLVLAASLPLGLALGHTGAAALVARLATEEIRIPAVVAPWCAALAIATTTGAAVLSSLVTWRALRHLDPLAVLDAELS
jgi:putative ABC transport system permease protein